MRTENEIREKISEYMDRRRVSPWWEEEQQVMTGVIDALLWVIGDTSGAEI